MDGLKQRVIGALVLVSLAVIFVPMLFDEPHSERSSRVISLPEEPPFPEVEMPEPVAVETPAYHIEEEPTADPVAEAKPAAPAPAPEPIAPPKPAPAPDPVAESVASGSPEPEPEPQTVDQQDFSRSLAGAWVVQLGSFGNADNARRLRDNVREQGFSSHLQQISRGDTALTRVFCGPFADKASAEQAKRKLDAAFGLNSLVTSNDS
ncbi:SPOR domain-containing protein [Marinobacter sp. SS21]|uniref:SPOR domain-containing protein n=1 Tax=Marinobacter sp. SS21 TaxID=2979460 RepID=UPI0023300ED5|nr:SPOR domain-containing protein [Marinobacter sp. SS21]MDC0661867.1 SPOR domain-containing protein [Marinobacter sp. SS21]